MDSRLAIVICELADVKQVDMHHHKELTMHSQTIKMLILLRSGFLRPPNMSL